MIVEKDALSAVVRRDLRGGAEYGTEINGKMQYANKSMITFAGKVVHFTSFDNRGYAHHIKEDEGRWAWSNDMFESVEYDDQMKPEEISGFIDFLAIG